VSTTPSSTGSTWCHFPTPQQFGYTTPGRVGASALGKKISFDHASYVSFINFHSTAVTQTQIGNVSTSDASVMTRGQPHQDHTQSLYAAGDAPAPVVYMTIIILFYNGTLAVFEAHSTL